MSKKLFLIVLIAFCYKQSLAEPDLTSGTSSDSDQGIDQRSRLLRVKELLHQLFSNIVSNESELSYSAISHQFLEGLHKSGGINGGLDENEISRLGQLKHIEQIIENLSCNGNELGIREEILSEYVEFPKLKILIDHKNKDHYQFCVDQLDKEILEYSEDNPSTLLNVRNLRNYVRNEMPESERSHLYIALTLRQLAQGIMKYFLEVEGMEWIQPDSTPFEEFMERFDQHIDQQFASPCYDSDEELDYFMDKFIWFDWHIENLVGSMSEASMIWLETKKICRDIESLDENTDILLEARYDFFDISDQVFLYQGEPILSTRETKNLIEQLRFLIEFRYNVYNENHSDINEMVNVFQWIEQVSRENCNVPFLEAFQGLLDEYKNYVNLGPFLKEIAHEQQRSCSSVVSGEIGRATLIMSVEDQSILTLLRTMVEMVEPILSEEYHPRISWSRFFAGLEEFFRISGQPIVSDSEQELSTQSIQRAIQLIGIPCGRLVHLLRETNELFDHLVRLHENFSSAFMPSDIIWMKNTKICLQLLSYSLPSNR